MLKPVEKAAVLLRYLGEDNVQGVLKLLGRDNATKLTNIMKGLDDVSEDTINEIIRETLNRVSTPTVRAKNRLTAEQANNYLKRFEEAENDETEEIDLIGFLQKADHKQLIELIKNEHPQVIAFILSFIPSDISSQIMPLLSPEMQADAAMRIATMGTPQKDMIKYLNKMLGNKIKLLTSKTMQVGGVESLVKIMKGSGRNSERIILDHFLKEKPELAYEIKNLMLIFEDLVLLDDASVQKILRDIDTKILAKALKKTTPEIRDMIMKNLSERARNILSEEIEALGMIPIKEVERAQQQVVEVVRQLEEKGEITINKEKEELV
jgi:flagellar motor switch protein FliG